MIRNRVAECGADISLLDLDALVSSIQLYLRESADPVRGVPTGTLERSMLLFERLAPGEGTGEEYVVREYPIVLDGLMSATSARSPASGE